MNEYTELIAELRDGADFQDAIDHGRIREAADAIEALVKERDEWVDRADDAYAYNSDVTDILEQFRETERERDELKREMHARELHHFEEEQKSAELAAEVERLRLVHAGQARLAMSAVFLADTDDDEGVQAFRAEWVKEHDARLIEGLADDMEGGFNRETWNLERRQIKRWLRERARQVREGEA